MNIKSRYEKEFRTVIDEHKKVALVNLEKLKQAETALKESTMSDEDMAALISFRQDQQQRRLSSGSIGSLQDESRKEDREKEKVLQKKLGELTTQVQRLERRISLLRTENDALRQKQDDQRPLEEKIKSLKKRNAELAAIARRLEEKAKNLQQENTKVKSKSPGTTTKDEITQDSDTSKRMLARQRAKDLAEHAKTMLAKDKEIEDLRRKCQQLANQLSDADLAAPVNAVQFEEKEELVNIIKQAAKERLQLEQQLAHTRTTPLPDTGDTPTQSSDKHKQELEAANQILHHEIEKLEQALHKAESLEQQLTDKTNECQVLTRELTQSRRLTQQLQVELGQVTEEKKRLVTDVAELTAKVTSIGQITEECNTLKLSLATAQKEREAAHEEVQHLNLRVHSLENLVRDLQESAESVSQLENERKLALSELQQKQAQLEQFQKASSSIESEHTQVVNKLNLQVLELEEKRKREEERREELSREVQRLKKEADERQKILEEAELLRAEFARIKKEAVISADTSLEPSHHPAVFHTQLINRGKGDNHGEGGEVEEVMDRKRQNQNERPMAESFLSAWAQKGPIQVYIAKYNYDPFEFSPNENPEAELPLTAGDYVLVVGEMDEDGFFDGELIDGRQGLVPSNFIEKVEDEDLAEFHAALMQAGHPDYTSASTTAAMAPLSTGPIISNNKLNNNNNELDYPVTRPKTDLQNGAGNLEESNSDLEDIAEIDEETASVNSRVLLNGGGSINHLPPSPRGLSLDRQLTNSLLISWKDPEPATGLEVQSYHIFVDGHFKTSVKSNERTKALLEGVNSSSVHRVCVRCLSNKGQSKDAQCTMLVGKDVYPVPSELKVCHVSPTSAALSWLPGDSNFQHSILVNGKEVRVVKPGVFRHTLTGLTPGALHKVTLIAKSISGTLIEEKSRKWVENVSASIEFHTPEAGAPEPPLNVQIESGPREGTILVSWLPVTINSSGVCNGAVVAGYHVMADNRRAKNVPGPTCDHVVLSSEDFKGLFPSHIAVRTVSTSGVESVNSDVVALPGQLIKELKEGSGIKGTERAKVSKSSSDDGKGHDTDEEIEAAFREAQSNTEKRSPQPAPRKLANAGADTGPKEFHDQKPKGDLLAAPARVVPAIEITRDSSTERTSADEDLEDGNIPSAVNTPTSPHGRSSDPPISSHYWGDVQKPSAFRQVDQTRRHDSGDAVRFDDDRSNSPAHVHPADHPTTVRANDPRSFPETQSPSQKQGALSSSAQNPNQRKHIPSDLSGAADEGGDNDSISGEINPVVDENSVRLFIALFDYDPTTMSPNVDSIDEELPFREGQILKVFGDKDADGFYKGESHGRRGYIPCNMVSEVQIDDPDLVEQLLKETTERLVSSQPSLASATRDLTPNGMASIPRDGPMRRMVALYDYDPQELSPNVDAELELSFKTGDIVLIYGEMDEDGFFTGEVNGQQGLVPSNFLQPAPLSDDEGLESVSVVSTARSRSGESLDAAVSALGRADVTANRVNESAPTRSESANSNRQPPGGATEGAKPDGSRPGTASPAEDEKPKKKGGFLNKSKNIFKKFTR
ncbi:peripheral-type benzodiazepine receptor-associated protein 1-like isoform X3 [Physella acuta]|uniref:peripheral-type benzodiazepine receptor-associated protein 1-like isoform X3 n=1 Tax=Physella acuta TaxID=109671 RepID=UPI0027DCF4F2|nr:peripheral-type benzodiazepine receptor-associated protein 1-like isoform X3 [Physella acuta]